MSKPFQFKQFTIHQDKAAMKIGTDGVLLGAWCSIAHAPESILDVGTGTGVIALQLAQRSNAMTIDAVEIEALSYEQAVENFERSPWGDRLFCYHSSFEDLAQEFAEEGESYDLIVSNPPFYAEDYQSENPTRNQARFTSALSFEDLLEGVVQLLSDQGVFSVILPYKEEVQFVNLALSKGLYVCRICRVRGTPKTDVKRSLLEFSKTKSKLVEEELTIEIERHQYTEQYKELTKSFYAKL